MSISRGLIACGLGAFPLVAVANVTPAEVASIAMIQAQGHDMAYVLRSFGAREANLSFTSSVAADGAQFSYNLAAGTRYGAHELSITSFAFYDPMEQLWHMTSFIGYHGETEMLHGEGRFVGENHGEVDSFVASWGAHHHDHVEGLGYHLHAHSHLQGEHDGVLQTIFDAELTHHEKVTGTVVGDSFRQRDGRDAGQWNWQLEYAGEGGPWSILSQGQFAAGVAGSGSFTVQLTPEPGALMTVLLLALLRRRG